MPAPTSAFTSNLVSNLIVAVVTAALSVAVTWVTATYVINDQPDSVTYKIKYLNTDAKQVNGIVVVAQVPAGSEYVMGSTYISTSHTKGRWTPTNDGITVRGLNIGSYAPGGNAYLKFTVRPRGKTTFTCSADGSVGTVSASGAGALTIWVTC